MFFSKRQQSQNVIVIFGVMLFEPRKHTFYHNSFKLIDLSAWTPLTWKIAHVAYNIFT